jgi:hypothetical protein
MLCRYVCMPCFGVRAACGLSGWAHVSGPETYSGKLRGWVLCFAGSIIKMGQAINELRLEPCFCAKEPRLAMHSLQRLVVCQPDHNKVLPEAVWLAHMKHDG